MIQVMGIIDATKSALAADAELLAADERTVLDDAASIHDEDHVGVADRGQPVRNHKRGPAAHERRHRPLDEDLGPRVH